MPAFELRIGALSQSVKETIIYGIGEHTIASLGVDGYSLSSPSQLFFIDSPSGPLVALECRLFWGSVLFKTIYESPQLGEAEKNICWQSIFDATLNWGKSLGCTSGLVLYAFQPSFIAQLLKYGFSVLNAREGWKDGSGRALSHNILYYPFSSSSKARSLDSPQVQKVTQTLYKKQNLSFSTHPLWEQTAPPMSFEYWHEDQLASAVAVGTRFDQWCVYLTYTHACSRGLGLAGSLLQQSLQWVQNQGGQFIDVETFSYQALPFYLKYDFVADYTVTGLYANVPSQSPDQNSRQETSFIFLRRYLHGFKST